MINITCSLEWIAFTAGILFGGLTVKEIMDLTTCDAGSIKRFLIKNHISIRPAYPNGPRKNKTVVIN